MPGAYLEFNSNHSERFELDQHLFLPGGASMLSDLTAPVVFAGYGLTVPGRKYDDYLRLNVKGKIVAYLPGAPDYFTADEKTFYGETKAQNAIAHGAIGTFILVPKSKSSISSLSTLLRRDNAAHTLTWLESGTKTKLQVSAQLDSAMCRTLFAGQAALLTKIQPKELNIKVHMAVQATFTNVSSPNIIGLLPGSDPVLRNEYVIISAHLDHLGKGDAIYPGTIDNASGIASLIEIARALRSGQTLPKRSILFIAFTGEEPGNIGSGYFVEHCPIPLKNIIADINIDGASAWPFDGLVPRGAEHSTLERTASLAATKTGAKVVPDPIPGKTSLAGSDQFSFMAKGIPSVNVGAGRSGQARTWALDWVKTRYHTPFDNMEQPMDLRAMANYAYYILAFAYEIANDSDAPHWNSNDFYKANL